MSKPNTLDPILQPALQLEQLPVIPERMGVLQMADELTNIMERLSARATIERDRQSAQQLANTAESLAVNIVNLVAYSRGRVPRVSSRKPDTNIIVS